MPTEEQKRIPEDLSKVVIAEPWQLEYWTKEFRVSRAEVQEAVRKVGDSTPAVRKHLGR